MVFDWWDTDYGIYSLIRHTIFYEKICLFDQSLLKTWGASYKLPMKELS